MELKDSSLKLTLFFNLFQSDLPIPAFNANTNGEDDTSSDESSDSSSDETESEKDATIDASSFLQGTTSIK